MKEVVTHVPITPRSSTSESVVPLGFYSLPNQARFLSKSLRMPLVMAINALNMKDSIYEKFISELSNLGIEPDTIWVDKVKTPEQISDIVANGLNNGWILQKLSNIVTCSEKGCGKSEFLHITGSLPVENTGHSTVRYDSDENIFCRLCDTQLKREQVDSLVWKIPNLSIEDVSLYPKYVEKELAGHLKDASGKEILISRSSTRNLSCNVEGKFYWLDPDFGNYSFLSILQMENLYADILVTGRNILMQTALMLALNKSMNCKNPRSILSSSKIYIKWGQDRGGSPKKQLSLENFLASGYSAKSIRLFLLQAMGTPSKEVELKSSDIFLAEISLKNLTASFPPNDERLNPKILLETPMHNQISQMLKLVRQNRIIDLTLLQNTLLTNS